ncbi:MAG: methyltransferase domain-containing protein [Bacteroidota bacterium]
MNKDLFGKALLDYWHANYTEDLVTWTSISDKDELPLDYLFRNFEEMPVLEQSALNLAKGKILDVGCGSGSHSLWLQEKGFEVTAIDISKGAVEVSKSRGVKQVKLKPLIKEIATFDTILLLMNGTGIFEEYSKLTFYLNHLKSILSPKGQILIDSSDIIYMFQDEDGGTWMNLNNDYYGNLDYYVSYKGEDDLPFKWLYLDYDRLKTACEEVGLVCEKIADGKHFDYLARISFK